MILRVFVFLLLLWSGVYFWQHPKDVHHPTKFLIATMDELNSVGDLLPISGREKHQPPGVLVSEAPSMTPVQVSAWKIGNDVFTPLFTYQIRARVLSKTHYIMGHEAKFAPYDLALGWKDMSDSKILRQIPVTQSNRWYYYTYPAASPIDPNAIPLESGNMHIIPANDDIRHTLGSIIKGNVIDLKGYLILIESPDGWKWRSGTSATGEGQGSCKVIWVTDLRIEN